jgi:hypothetical protein
MQVNTRNSLGRIHSPWRLLFDHHTVVPLRSGTRLSGRLRTKRGEGLGLAGTSEGGNVIGGIL